MRREILLVGLLSGPACGAPPGIPPENILNTTVTAEPAGPSCSNGGTKIETGVAPPAYVCDGATGAEGQTGPQGADGPTGAPGVSVTARTLLVADPDCPAGGSAFDSSSGTTFACNGTVGPQGAQGVVGETGPEGPQGIVGETGPEGPQGVAGNRGPQGPRGLAGPSSGQIPGGLVAFSTATHTVIADSQTLSDDVGVVTVALPAEGPLTLIGGFPDPAQEQGPTVYQRLVINRTPLAGRAPGETAFSVQLTRTGAYAGTCSTLALSPEEPVARQRASTSCGTWLSAMLVSDSLVTITAPWVQVAVETTAALGTFLSYEVDPGGTADDATVRVQVRNLGTVGAHFIVGAVCPSPIDVVPAQDIFLEVGEERWLFFDIHSPVGIAPSTSVGLYIRNATGQIYDELTVDVSPP